MIVGIDGGNDRVKVIHALGYDRFPSTLGEYRELKLTNKLGKYDFWWEYKGEKGFAGTLAENESEAAAKRYGETKAHHDGTIRVLIALHRISDRYGAQDFYIVTGQPIARYETEEKGKIKEALEGRHEFFLNGQRKVIVISRCEVAPEGAGILVHPFDGLLRGLDIGSGTVNYITVKDRQFRDRDSFSSDGGTNTFRSTEAPVMARRIALAAMGRWKQADQVKVFGGGAFLLPHIREYFPSSELLQPAASDKVLDSSYTNAAAFYEIGRKLYG